MNDVIIDAIGNLDSEIIESYLIMKEQLRCKRKAPRINSVWKKCIAAAACFAVILSTLLAGGIINPSDKQAGVSDDNISSGLGTGGTGEGEVITSPDGNWATVYYRWNGLLVSEQLLKALNEAEHSDYLTIQIRAEYDDSFVYKGITLSEMKEIYSGECSYQARLNSLCRGGGGDSAAAAVKAYEECVKNGEEVTPAVKEYYEHIVERYGEMLDKYISDGVFLRDVALDDLEEQESKVLEVNYQYNEHLRAYDRFLSESLYEELKENYTVSMQVYVHVSLTKAELADLKLENKEQYIFELSNESEEEGVYVDVNGVHTWCSPD